MPIRTVHSLQASAVAQVCVNNGSLIAADWPRVLGLLSTWVAVLYEIGRNGSLHYGIRGLALSNVGFRDQRCDAPCPNRFSEIDLPPSRRTSDPPFTPWAGFT